MHRTSVVRRWNVAMVIRWRLASGLFDRVAQRRGSAKAPVFSVDVFAHALLLHHNAASLRSFLGFSANFLHYFRFSAYYRLRPQVRPGTSPTPCSSCLPRLGHRQPCLLKCDVAITVTKAATERVRLHR